MLKIFRKVLLIILMFTFFISGKISYANEIAEPKINSRIAVVYDRDTGNVVWGKNENKRTAMASTTKIMTAIVVVESTDLNSIVTVSSKAASTGGSRLGLKKGDKISVKDLLYGLMLRSGNDTAIALAEYVGGDVEGFAELMNNKAQDLKLKDTHFVTPHGLDHQDHYTTAFELAKIADYALNNETIKNIVGTKYYTISINGYPKNLVNTNELLGYLNGVYGVKTGFTNNAGRCLVTSVKRDDIDVITVVLQADTKKDRTNDSIEIIEYIYKNYVKVNLDEIVDEKFQEWCLINKGRINIKKAKSSCIELKRTSLNNNFFIVRKDFIDKITIDINAVFEHEAPLQNNTITGKIKVLKDDEIIDMADIYICGSVEKKSIMDYVFQCLKKFK